MEQSTRTVWIVLFGILELLDGIIIEEQSSRRAACAFIRTFKKVAVNDSRCNSMRTNVCLYWSQLVLFLHFFSYVCGSAAFILPRETSCDKQLKNKQFD